MADAAEGAVVSHDEEYDSGSPAKRERKERRNDGDGLPQAAQMQDLFDKLKLDDVDSLQKSLNSIGNSRRRGGKKEDSQGEGKASHNLNRAVQIGNTIAKRYKTMEKQVESMKKNESVFQQLRTDYEEASVLNTQLRSELETMVDELKRENAMLKEFISSKGLTAPTLSAKGGKSAKAGMKGKGKAEKEES